MASRRQKKARRPLEWKIENYSRLKERTIRNNSAQWNTLVLRETSSKILKRKGVQRKYFLIEGVAGDRQFNLASHLLEIRQPLWYGITQQLNNMGLDANAKISLGISVVGADVPGTESSWGVLENLNSFSISDLDWQLERLASYLQSDKSIGLNQIQISLTVI